MDDVTRLSLVLILMLLGIGGFQLSYILRKKKMPFETRVMLSVFAVALFILYAVALTFMIGD